MALHKPSQAVSHSLGSRNFDFVSNVQWTRIEGASPMTSISPPFHSIVANLYIRSPTFGAFKFNVIANGLADSYDPGPGKLSQESPSYQGQESSDSGLFQSGKPMGPHCPGDCAWDSVYPRLLRLQEHGPVVSVAPGRLSPGGPHG